MNRWRNSYYVRLVVSYTALALVLIGFTGGYLLTNADRLVIREVAKDARYNLLNIANHIENNFLRVHEDAFFTKVLTTVNPNSNEALNDLLERPARGNISKIVSFIDDLGLIANMSDGLDGITVYLRKGNYVMDDYRYFEVPDNSPDAEFLHSLDTAPVGRWFDREKTDIDSNGNAVRKQVMSYVFTLPYMASPEKASGFLIVDIGKEYLNSMVRSVIQTPNSRLYVFDADGRILIGDGQGAESEREEVHQFYRAAAENGFAEEERSVRLGGNVVSMLPGTDSSYGWTYVLVRPMDSFLLATDKLKRQVWTACFIALLLGVAVSFMMSRHFYIPLKKLLYSIRNLYAGPPPAAVGHEYAVIDQMLAFIDRRMLQMKDAVREKQIAELLAGRRTAAGLEGMPALPLECRYAAVYLTAKPEHAEALERAAEQTADWNAEWIGLSSTEMALLVFIPADCTPSSAVLAALGKLGAAAEGVVFGAGVGTVVDSADEIPISFANAKEAHRFTFVFGRNAVIAYDDIAERREGFRMPHIDCEPFLLKIQSGDADGAKAWLDETADRLRREPLAVETVELCCLRIGTELSQVMIEQKLQDALPVFGFHEAAKGRTMAESFALLAELSGEVARLMQEKRSDAHLEKVEQLKRLIRERLAEDLSLDELARHVQLSPNYVSTLFSSVTGESFIEYLNRMRLEKAARLLAEDPKLSVAAIAKQTGYRNSQYFCNRFKARYGVTPSQYRTAEGMRTRLAE